MCHRLAVTGPPPRELDWGSLGPSGEGASEQVPDGKADAAGMADRETKQPPALGVHSDTSRVHDQHKSLRHFRMPREVIFDFLNLL